MTASWHTQPLLGGYVLGVLDADEHQVVQEHLRSCPECRAEAADLAAMRDALGEVPPEAFLEGPPDGGDLLLRRTLRAVRAERVAPDRRRRLVAAAAVVALAAGGVITGVAVGRSTAPQVAAEPAATATPSGTRAVTGTDSGTGVTLTATITPATGWVRVHAEVEGVPAGKKCELVVVDKNGNRTVAGSWVAPQVKPGQDGAILDGSALVNPTDVAAVEVLTTSGEELVSVPV